MAEPTLTLKLPFHRLNQVKAAEFDRLTAVNTQVANDLLKVEKSERKKLKSSAFRHVKIGSACWEGVLVESYPPAYTSKSDHHHGVIGKRVKHWFIGFDGYRCHAEKCSLRLQLHDLKDWTVSIPA